MPWRGWEGGFRERGEAAAAQPGKDSRGQDGRDGRGQPARGTHPRFTRDPDSEASGARGASACPPPRATGCGKHQGGAVRSRCHRVHSGGRRSLPRSRVGLLVTLRVPPGARKTEPTPSAALPAFAPLPPTATCAGSVFHRPGDLEPVPGIQLGRAPPEREHQPGCGGGARSELCADQVSNILSIWRSSPFGASLPLAVPTPNLVPFRLRLRWPCPLRAQ